MTLVSHDLWEKVCNLPLDVLAKWAVCLQQAARNGEDGKVLRLLESLEMTARLQANPMYREACEAADADLLHEPRDPIDIESFVADMRAKHGRPQLRNKVIREFPNTG